MQTYQLVPQGSFAPRDVSKVTLRWSSLPDGRLMLRYRVDGCESLVVPDFRGKGRGDELWQHTCFELFLYDGEGRYREFNFSPCQQWAAYRFAGYRNGREDFEPVVHPDIAHERGRTVFTLTTFLSAKELEGAQMAAATAVIEEEGGRPSYRAMVHNRIEPDFHDPMAFRIRLDTESAGAGDAA